MTETDVVNANVDVGLYKSALPASLLYDEKCNGHALDYCISGQTNEQL